MIIVVFGLPGSGKSYFAARLAKNLNADYVNSDGLRKEMFAVRTYSEQEKAAVYKAMLQRMKEALKQSRSIVLDATFHIIETRNLFTREAKAKDRICFIEITTNENLARQRLNKERAYSEADFEVYQLTRRHWEPLKEAHLILESTDENIESMLKKAAEYLNSNDDPGTNK